MKVSLRKPWRLALALALLPQAAPVAAFDIPGVQQLAVDQPQIFATLRTTPTGDPLIGDYFGFPVSAIQAYLDTGASGIILSELTAGDVFNLPRYAIPSTPTPLLVEFRDIGIGGTALFNVSQPLYLSLAPGTLATGLDPGDPTKYGPVFGPVRTQIGPLGAPASTLGGTDVFGMPAMAGKVVVMDPKPTNSFGADPFDPTSQMRTFVYSPGTAYNPATPENPGIPNVNRTVKLSQGSFERFTTTTPASAEPPTLERKPFIGPDPTAGPGVPPDSTPGVTIAFGNLQTTGSFLLDTGAVASSISTKLAADLHVRLRENQPVNEPVLEFFDGSLVPNQFRTSLGGIGGEVVVPGFYLDSLLIRTMQGAAGNDLDPAHLRYLDAPVLVFDVTLEDPTNHKLLTLDGLIGMNLLVASAVIEINLSDPFLPIIVVHAFNPSAFNWIVFDQQAGILGLDVAAVPEPGTWAMIAAGLVFLAFVARRRARQIA